jgi:hypothetical protein
VDRFLQNDLKGHTFFLSPSHKRNSMFQKHGISALEEEVQKKGQNLELLPHSI